MKKTSLLDAILGTYVTFNFGVQTFTKASVICGILAIISLFFSCLDWYDVIKEAIKIKEKEKIDEKKRNSKN